MLSCKTYSRSRSREYWKPLAWGSKETNCIKENKVCKRSTNTKKQKNWVSISEFWFVPMCTSAWTQNFMLLFFVAVDGRVHSYVTTRVHRSHFKNTLTIYCSIPVDTEVLFHRSYVWRRGIQTIFVFFFHPGCWKREPADQVSNKIITRDIFTISSATPDCDLQRCPLLNIWAF